MLLQSTINNLSLAETMKKSSFRQSMKDKPIQIGSIKTQRVNFDNDEQFFTDRYVPQSKRMLKSEIKTFKDPDILELRKKEWNISTEKPKYFDQFIENHSERLLKIKHGFYDDKKITMRPNRIFQGTETRDSFDNWNVSVEVNKKQVNNNLLAKTRESLANTIKLEKTILTNYLKPIQRYELSNQKLKQRDESEQQLKQSFMSEYRKFNPRDSEQKTKAKVAKMLEVSRMNSLKLRLFGDRQIQENLKQFRASLTPKQKQKIQSAYHHSGIWSKIKCKDNQEEGWSCCMNDCKDSPGCVKTKIDRNKMNFASFNN